MYACSSQSRASQFLMPGCARFFSSSACSFDPGPRSNASALRLTCSAASGRSASASQERTRRESVSSSFGSGKLGSLAWFRSMTESVGMTVGTRMRQSCQSGVCTGGMASVGVAWTLVSVARCEVNRRAAAVEEDKSERRSDGA